MAEFLFDVDDYYTNWASSGDRVNPGRSKMQGGFRLAEVPGSGHLNWTFHVTGNWNANIGRKLAARMAMANVQFGITSFFGTDAAALHITYDTLADRWYAVKTVSGTGVVQAYDAAFPASGWSAATTVATAASSPYYPDVSKAVTNGTNVAIAVDDKVYYSSDDRVANLDAGTTFAGITKVSDLVWDDDNSLWIACGANVTPKGVIETATIPTGTWTNRRTATTATDFNAMATDLNGQTVVVENQGTPSEFVYSSNGTTWNLSTTDPDQTFNQVAWAPSLGLFVGLGFTNNYLYTSTDGDVWRNQNTINGVPALYNIGHTPDFFIAWGEKTAGGAGVDYSDIYAFHTNATDADSFNYQKIGRAWGEAIPRFPDDTSIMHGGKGFMPFLYHSTSDYLATARYGAG